MSKFVKPTISWSEFEKLVPPDQKGKFLAFKGKSQAYLQRVLANPAVAPKIDWEAYSKSVPIEGLVSKLKSAYESFKVPYPSDTLSSKVDEQWNAMQPKIKEYCAEQQKIISEAEKELKRINDLPPIDSITLEMYYDMNPSQGFDPVKRPTFWPHTEDEQEGYQPPEQKAQTGKA